MRKSPVHWLEAIVSGAGILALALALLFATAGAAHAQLQCVPGIGSPGTRIVTQTHAFGEWRYMWCPDVASGLYPDGKPKAWVLHRHATLTKYAKTVGDPLGMVVTVINSPFPLAAINAAISGAAIPPANPQELYEFKTLLYAACQHAVAPPVLVDILPVSGTFCGTEPVPPPPVPAVWVTQPGGNSLYTVVGGALSAKIIGRTAAPNVACDCASPIVRGTLTYCPLAGGIPSEVTSCKVKP